MNIPTAENNEVRTSSKKQLVVAREALSFDKLIEGANLWSQSTIVPMQYQHRPENCMVALDMATRIGATPMFIMQNLYVVQGKPSWSGSACNALIRNCGRFKDIEIKWVGVPNTDSWGAYMTAIDQNGKALKGTTVTIRMAKAEGWYGKNGSKWQTMPEQMLVYRASALFARAYAPDVLMGLHTVDEVEDYVDADENIVEERSDPYEKAETN